MGCGGIEQMLVNTARRIDITKFQFDALLWEGEVPFFREQLKETSTRLIYVKKKETKNRILNYLYRIISIYFFCRTQKDEYDIIHFHDGGMTGYLYCTTAKIAGIKSVILHSRNSHDVSRLKEVLLYPIRFITHSFIDGYLACSKDAAKFSWPKSTSNKVTEVIRNGIDVNKYVFNESIRNRIRQEIGCENVFIVGNVGRFHKQKNHHFMLDIFSEIVNIRENSVLLLVGEGALENDIREYAKSLGVYDKVVFYGTSHAVNELMMAMDVFLFPSRYEGFGNVAIEAQATGLSVYASDQVSSETNVSPLVHYFSLSTTAAEWAKAIIYNEDNVSRENAFSYIIEAGYDSSTTYKQYENVYSKLFERLNA